MTGRWRASYYSQLQPSMSLAKKIHLADGENVVAMVRSFWITYAWGYALAFLLLGAAFFFVSWLLAHGWLGYALVGLGVAAGLYIVVVTWFFNHSNVLVITNQRVVDVARFSWFDETVSALSFLDIKDVIVRRHGILPTLFNYGLVTIVAKNQSLVVEADRVHFPERLQRLVQAHIERYRSDRRLGNSEAVYNGFIKIISQLPKEKLIAIQERINIQLQSRTGGGESSDVV